MTSSPEHLAVRFDDDSFWVHLDDGRALGVSRACSTPRLFSARKLELSHSGLHREEIDKDISIAGLLAGHGDQTRVHEMAA